MVKAKAWSKLNGGMSSKTDAVMDSGCIYPVTTTAVTKEMKTEIKPLREELTIIEASGKTLKVLVTVKMFLEADVLGGRKLEEAAVIEGEGSKETLISLDLLKKWELIHSSFPHETISDYVDKKYNKKYQAYSSLNGFQSNISGPMQELRKKCKRLK